MKIGLTRIEWLILLCIGVILFSIGRDMVTEVERLEPVGTPEKVVWVQINEPAMSSHDLFKAYIQEGTLYFSNGGLVFVPGK